MSITNKKMRLDKISGMLTEGTLDQLNESDLRTIITQQYHESKKKDTRLKGLQVLTTRLYESEECVRLYRVKSENLQEALQLAQARIAQLNIDYGVGPQTAFNLTVDQPGVSQNKFDKVVRENAKLKEDLDNFVGKDLGGHDIILENNKLHDLVSTLQRDLSQRSQHFNELNAALQNSGNPVLQSLPKLQLRMMQLTKNVEASDTLARQLTVENTKLKQLLQESERSKEGQLKNGKNNGFSPNEDDVLLKERNEELEKEVKTMNEWLNDAKTAQNVIEEEKKDLRGEVDLLRKRVSEQHNMMEEMERDFKNIISNLKEEIKNEQSKNEAFFKQSEELTQKQKKYEDELQSLRTSLMRSMKECEEAKATNGDMKQIMTIYENDFAMEHQKNIELEKENRTLKKMNQSHMATVTHLEDEYERISKMLENEKRNKSRLTGDSRKLVTVSDYGINEKDAGASNASVSLPVGGKHEKPHQASLIECPYCSRHYPVHLIEEHVQSCGDDD